MNMRQGLLAFIALWMGGEITLHAATVTAQPWGKDATGNAVDLYTLKEQNAEVQLTTYGARIVSIRVPDKTGQMSNVVLGSPNLEGYIQGRVPFEGATIGRFANRIAGGKFDLGGKSYEVPKNNGPNALHGGTVGFDKRVWSAKPTKDGVVMTLVSADGDMGFPGNLTVSVASNCDGKAGRPHSLSGTQPRRTARRLST